MGNSPQALPVRDNGIEGFGVAYVGHVFVEAGVAFEFMVQPPSITGAPGQVVRRSYEDLDLLSAAMSARYHRVPPCPRAPFFTMDNAWLGDQGRAIEAYLRSLLALEPWPRTNALRRFLSIAVPPGPVNGPESVGPALLCRQRVPVSCIAIALSFADPLAVMHCCAKVCKTFHAASLDPRCWPRLHFRTHCAEKSIDSLCTLLLRACGGLEALTLDLIFQRENLGVALPAGLLLPRLRRLDLRLGDAESTSFACELLGCVESPVLRDVTLSAVFTPSLLQALCMTLIAAEGKVTQLSLVSSPCSRRPDGAQLDASTVLGIQEIVEAVPLVQSLAISIDESSRGSSRFMEGFLPPFVEIPGQQPLLANLMALGSLQTLQFDFLSDDVIACLATMDERVFHVRSARFSGCKRRLEDPDEALVRLLSKMGPELQEFSFLVDQEFGMRAFSQGLLHQRLGGLPSVWSGHENLRSLELNWNAFDDEGIASIVEACPQLEVMLLDRAEYWTDAAVMHLVEGLPTLRRLRIRSSTMLSDRALDVLQQSTQQFRLLEIEPSYTMSTYMLDQLRSKLTRGSTNLPEIFPGSFTAMLLLGDVGPPGFEAQGQGQPCSELKVLKPEHEEEGSSLSIAGKRTPPPPPKPKRKFRPRIVS
ncbi:unnamed protein product [Symbiodinium sp. KB8]|nr:unnamed protein product [Symbiodinium sp. KB8]